MRRILRRYRRIAHTEHHCDRCQSVIFPGEEYEGEVILADQYNGGRAIVVYKPFWHREKRDAFCAWNRAAVGAGHLRQDEVDDVIRHVVFTPGDEYFLDRKSTRLNSSH